MSMEWLFKRVMGSSSGQMVFTEGNEENEGASRVSIHSSIKTRKGWSMSGLKIPSIGPLRSLL